MHNWPETSLGTVANISIGGTPSRNEPRFWAEPPSGHPWLSIRDLQGKYVSDTSERITDAGVRYSNVKLIPAGTPVMSFKLSIGRCAIAARDLYSNEAIAAFHVVPSVLDRNWLYFALPRTAGRAITDSAIKGATLNKRKLAQLILHVPPLPEQRLIAEILDTVDLAIRKTEAIIAKLGQVKQGLLHDLLTRGIDDNGQLRDPDRHPEQFKDSPLGRIPKEWEVTPLWGLVRDDAPITYGIVQAGPHVPDGVPYIRTGDMSGDELSVSDLMRTSTRVASGYTRSRILTGEIVCAIRATVGKVLPVLAELEGANLTQGTARIAPGPAINRQYLLWAMRSFAVQRQFDLAIKGTTFREITLGQLRLLNIPHPTSKYEQEQIGVSLEQLSHREKRERDEAEKLRLLKQGLMDDLLTGRVRVTNVLQEAAT